MSRGKVCFRSIWLAPAGGLSSGSDLDVGMVVFLNSGDAAGDGGARLARARRGDRGIEEPTWPAAAAASLIEPLV